MHDSVDGLVNERGSELKIVFRSKGVHEDLGPSLMTQADDTRRDHVLECLGLDQPKLIRGATDEDRRLAPEEIQTVWNPEKFGDLSIHGVELTNKGCRLPWSQCGIHEEVPGLDRLSIFKAGLLEQCLAFLAHHGHGFCLLGIIENGPWPGGRRDTIGKAFAKFPGGFDSGSLLTQSIDLECPGASGVDRGFERGVTTQRLDERGLGILVTARIITLKLKLSEGQPIGSGSSIHKLLKSPFQGEILKSIPLMGSERTMDTDAIPLLNKDLRDAAIIKKSNGDTNSRRSGAVLSAHLIRRKKNGKNCRKDWDLSDQKRFQRSTDEVHRSTVRKTG